MYNRYIPQEDGSYRRNRMPDNAGRNSPSEAPQIEQERKPERPQQQQPQPDNIFNIFRNLLPNKIDTGDLIIILLVLLMANDCEQDRNHALLTLALYFFL